MVMKTETQELFLDAFNNPHLALPLSGHP
jgi:hypothetical protein